MHVNIIETIMRKETKIQGLSQSSCKRSDSDDDKLEQNYNELKLI